MASSTDVGNLAVSPLATRIKLAMVPMKPSGNQDPFDIQRLPSCPGFAIQQSIFEAVRNAVRVIHIQTGADLDRALAALKFDVGLLFFGPVGVAVICHDVDAWVVAVIHNNHGADAAVQFRRRWVAHSLGINRLRRATKRAY